MDIMSNIFHDNINWCFSESFFPENFKRAEVIPILKEDIKKDSKKLKENYIPVSILPNISKIYETCLHNELSSYFKDIFSDSQFGFRISISAQQCLKASQKLNALACIFSYMNINQRKRIMIAFISSQFGYSPLVWFFCSRKIKNRINGIQERALRIAYKIIFYTFAQLNSVSIHIRNLQVSATQIFKVNWNSLQAR